MAAVAIMLLGIGAACASTVPSGFTETVIPGPFAGLWGKPVGTTFDATGRMFVWERLGRLWIKGPTETNFTQLLSIEEEQGTEGLLGFALDPNFQANGYIYLLYVVDRHHLLYYGTGNYNSSSNLYNEATIARLTRYTCVASNDFKTVNPASRLILIGDSKTNGFPICFSTHTIGSLVFGEDGTLLISCGDTGSFATADTGGAVGGSYAPQALADGIIRPAENVGSYRAQLVDCLDGKVLRIDPATGNGLPSNPFYDPAKPRAAKSRVWALGIRQPFRMTLRPDSGSHNPADGNPGVLYLGDVGFDTRESLKVITGPGQNFGWPLYEGLELTPNYSGGSATFNVDINNLDATNAACGGYFSFRQLLKADTTNAANFPPFNNPCNASLKIPTNIPQFNMRRASLDWIHGAVSTRTPTYDASGNATIATVGAVGSPVTGSQFQGNCSIGGAWYTGTTFPSQYQNKYFHADWGQGVIELMNFDTNDQPKSVNGFASNVGPIVNLVQHPFDGSLYYVLYDGDTGTVWKLAYTGNRTPVAVASADQYYGTSPLTVQFNGSASSDPDAQTITYSWNFGDGTANSTQANPSHVFTVPGGSARTNYTVTLTVTDSGGLPASTTLNIALNDTPPNVTITSPPNGGFYSPNTNSPFNLTATVTDAESSDSQLTYLWQSVLHHNDHNHVLLTSTNHTSSTLLEPIGCDGVNIYYYRIILSVTDPNGLTTTKETRLYPDCGATDTPATITDIPNQNISIGGTAGPIAFTIGDAQVFPANLQLSAGSSNPTLVPTNNIVFGGSGANRTVTVTPAPSLSGTSTITINVNDGPNNTVDTFVLTVGGSNTPPTISSIANQTVGEGTPATAAFTVADPNTPLGSLVYSASSSNPTLVPPGNFTFGGSGSNRTVTAIPAVGQTGTGTIMVTVSDGTLSASNSFTLTVTNLPPGTGSATNAATITINDASAASPYPSVINIAGLGGAVTNVTLTLRGLSHGWGRDIDALLVGPGGQKLMFMSDAGTGATEANANFTFSDNAATFLPATGSLLGGTYKPTDYTNLNYVADAMPAPAPAGPYATNLSVFNGQIANGAWSLYIVDDGPGDAGSIASGWSLTVTTTSAGPPPPQPPTITAIADQTTLTNTPVGPLAFIINDADTPIGSLTLSNASSNPTLVSTNNIVFGGSGSNRTVTVTPAAGQTGTANISIFVSDGTNFASDTFLLTVNGGAAPQVQSFTNAAAIAILDNQAASPYPSTLNVTGMNGIVSNVTITLFSLSHQWGRDIDALLVGPSGQKVMFLSDAGTTPTATNANFTFSDSAASFLPAAGSLVGGTYKPTDYTNLNFVPDVMPAPAPFGPYATNLAAFGGQTPNGAWSLYVLDDGPGETGSIAGGWSVTITTIPGTPSNNPPTMSSITNRTTLVNTATAAIPFSVFDAETAASNLVFTVFSSNTGLVPTNQIVLGGSDGNRTVTVTPASNQLGSATISLNVNDGEFIGSNSFVLTVNPAPLTVTENSFSRGYGATNPVLTGSIAGLQAGDTITATFTSTATTNSPVGAYPITFTFTDPGGKLGNYVITTNNGTLTVTNALLTVTANSTNKVYGTARTFAGTEFAVTSGTLINGNTLTNVTLASAGAAATGPVGTYPLTAANAVGFGLSNYAITYVSGTFTVTPLALAVTANTTNKTYGATRIFAGTEFLLTGGTLFNGNTLTNATLGSTGTNAAATIGSYPITITNAVGLGASNYVISYTNSTLTVVPAALTVAASNTNKVYGANRIFAGTEFAIAGGALFNGNTLTNVTLGSAGTNSAATVGSYPISVTNALGLGLTNYTIVYTNGTLTVTPAALTVTAGSSNKVYGATRTFAGTEFAITGGTLFNGNTLTSVTLVSVGAAGTAAVGNYAITPSAALGLGVTNYAIGYSNGTLTVGAASLLITVGSTNKVYGTTLNPAAFSATGLLNSDGVTGVTLTSAGSPGSAAVGGYAINGSGATGPGLTNYTIGYSNGTLTVGAASLLVTAGNTNKVYGTTLNPTAYSAAGLVNGDTVTNVSLASAGSGNLAVVGNYPINALGASGLGLTNYTIGYSNGTLTVGVASLSITAGNTNKIYGAVLNPTAFSVTGLLNGDSVTNVTLSSAGSVSSAAAGSYPITASGGLGLGLTNYTVGYNDGTLTVGAANLLVTAGNTNKIYGTTLSPTAFSVAGLLNSDNVTGVTLSSAGSVSNADVGNYAVIASDASGDGLTNYTIGYSNGTLTVGAANLLITAHDTNKVYGATLNPTGFSAAGLLNGDSITNVTLASAGSVSNAPVGEYPITPVNAAGPDMGNYAISYSNGTLTVTHAVLLAKADHKSRAYGEPNPTLTVSYAGFVNGEGANVLNALPVADTTATNASAPGDYVITLLGGADDNYSLSLSNGVLTVMPPGSITITSTVFIDADHFRLEGVGDANVTYSIESSSDLVNWEEIGTTTADGSGDFEYVDTEAAEALVRFYRVALP